MVVLGIETTCDETAAAVVERPRDGPGRILSNIVLSQINEHAAFGGVVPEIAARAHVEALDLVIAQAMDEAGNELRRSRRHRGRRRAGPDRRRDRRADHRQGDRARVREAADRRQSSRSARADGAAHRRARRFPIACSWHPADTPRSSRCSASASMCGSAPRSTTRSAKPSTRPRSCWASAIRAARRSSASAAQGNVGRFALPRPMHGRPHADFLALGPEDRAAARSREGSRR